MPWDDSTYVIVPTAEVTQEMVDVSNSFSIEDLVKSTSGSNSLLEYSGSPAGVSCFDGYDKYTHAQILPFIRNSSNGWREA